MRPPAAPVFAPVLAPGPAHEHRLRVYYEDTDAGGVVYHARMLAFAERARTEMLREAGAPHDALRREHGLMFMVRRVEVEYWRPALLDDALLVRSDVLALGAATAELRQDVLRAQGAVPLATLLVRLACVGRDGRPARIPPPWRAAMRPGPAVPGAAPEASSGVSPGAPPGAAAEPARGAALGVALGAASRSAPGASPGGGAGAGRGQGREPSRDGAALGSGAVGSNG